ncbi:MFS transporter [Streptomyces sp. NPDC047072]|uniref:MFS transporter n=1 Tax=Streptomyces sp. NPDC047072 TaxID=3154809 RepID=UPI0033F6C3B7
MTAGTPTDPPAVEQREAVTEPESLFRSVAFRWYYLGTTVSLTGSAMAPVALAFAVLALSHRAADLGLVLAARTVPLVAFLLLGGAVADRFPRMRVLRLSNAGAALTQGTAATLLITHAYSLGAIMALEFLNGALSAFTMPAMRGIVPQLVPSSHQQRANSLMGSTKNAVNIFGPSLAGVTVATVGGGWAIALDSVTYLVAAFCMTRFRVTRKITGRSSIIADIRDGWTGFRSLTWVWTVVLSLAVTNCVRSGVFGVLGPEIALHSIGASAWGVVLSARAVGVLALGLLMYRLTFTRLLATGQTFLMLGSVPVIALGLHAPAWLLVLTTALAGAGSGVFGPAWETSLQQHVPNEMLSRISSYDDLVSFVGVPVGQAAVGPLAAAFGDTRVALTGGVVFLVAAFLPLLAPSVRHLRSQ